MRSMKVLSKGMCVFPRVRHASSQLGKAQSALQESDNMLHFKVGTLAGFLASVSCYSVRWIYEKKQEELREQAVRGRLQQDLREIGFSSEISKIPSANKLPHIFLRDYSGCFSFIKVCFNYQISMSDALKYLESMPDDNSLKAVFEYRIHPGYITCLDHPDKVQVMIDVEKARRNSPVRGNNLPKPDALSEFLEAIDFNDPVARVKFIAGIFENLADLETSNVVCCF